MVAYILISILFLSMVAWLIYELKHAPNEKELWDQPDEFKGERYRPLKGVA